jgi:hypothetical protein
MTREGHVAKRTNKTAKGTKKEKNYDIVDLGNALLIKFKGGRRSSGSFKKARKPPVKIGAPTGDPLPLCHLTGTLYDFESDTTTFMYECDRAIDAQGHTSYTRKKRGYFDLST